MRILDLNGFELDPETIDYSLGYLRDEEILIAEIPEQTHLFVKTFYFDDYTWYNVTGEDDPHVKVISISEGLFDYVDQGEGKKLRGMDVCIVVDQAASKEYEKIKRYIPYTDEEKAYWEKMNQRILDTEEGLKASKDNIESNTNDINSINNSLSNINNTIETIQTDSSDMSDNINTIADNIAYTRQELSDTKAELQSTNDNLAATNDNVASSLESIGELNVEVNTTKDNLRTTNMNLQTTDSNLQETNGNVEDIILLLSEIIGAEEGE